MTIVTEPQKVPIHYTLLGTILDTEPKGAYTLHTAGYNIGDKVDTADTVNTVDT